MPLPRIHSSPRALLGSALKLLCIGAVVVALAPPLRERAAPHVAPAVNPIRTVMVKDEVTRVSAFVERDVRTTGLAPQGRDLPLVLRKMFPGREDALVDPWGTRYFLHRRGAFTWAPPAPTAAAAPPTTSSRPSASCLPRTAPASRSDPPPR